MIMKRPIHRIRRFLIRHSWIYWTMGFVILFFAAVFTLYFVERQVNPQLTIFDSFSMVLVFLLGEYGETPHTEAGRVISLIVFMFGILVVATIIGKITAFFVKWKMEDTMPKQLENHIVICNWNDRGDRIIKEIHAPLGDPEREIIVITEIEVNEKQLRTHEAYEKVFFIISDPTLHDVLKHTRAHLARSVIILADDQVSDPDAKTALIALAITKLEKTLPHKPHMIAEVKNHRKVQHLIDAGVDEWVCAVDFGLGIIAQSALYSKLSDVYQQLLTYSEETNEIYLVDNRHYPSQWVGKSFTEISEYLTEHRHADNPAILLGVKRGDKIILNPRRNEFDTLKEGDNLIIMAFDRPDLRIQVIQ